MGYDEVTAARVRRILSGREDVVEQRMVGGLSFLVGGSICCGVTSGGLMARVGSEAREEALTVEHVRPMVFGGRAFGGFVLIEPEGYQSEDALVEWVQRSIDCVATLPAKK